MKRYTPKGKPKKEESVYMEKVAHLPCCDCGAFGVQVNHVTEGMRRLGNFYTIPLCPKCHAKVDAKGFQWELEKCRQTHKKLGRAFIEPFSKMPRRI